VTTERAVRAYFVIAGFPDSPDSITQLLGIAPGESGRAGDHRTRRGGVSYVVKDSFWELTGTVINNTSIDPHVLELLDRLSGLESKLESLAPEVIKKIVIVVAVTPHLSPPGWYLDAATLKRLVTLGIDVEVDIG